MFLNFKIIIPAAVAAAAAYQVSRHPHRVIRGIVRLLVEILYRVRLEDAINIPPSGPVLFVSNHVSFVDPFFIISAVRRPVFFLVFRRYYDNPVFNWAMKYAGCIPISDQDSPKAILKSIHEARRALEEGKAVCIFAEGRISRHGQVLGLKKGFAKIVRRLEIPIVPVHLDRLWGSIFSYQGGRVILKWPRRLHYPVTITFGKPLPASISPFDARQAIVELGTVAFSHRILEKKPLPDEFCDEAKRHWARFAAGDSRGRKASFGKILTCSLFIKQKLRGIIGPWDRVGILFPPSIDGVLANIAVSSAGAVPVNLDFGLPLPGVLKAAEQAGLKRIITSRKFTPGLEKGKAGVFLFMEDLNKPCLARIFLEIKLILLPSFLIRRMYIETKGTALDGTAGVVGTVGRTGPPKSIMLSHANILSCIEGMGQVYDISQNDIILGLFPFHLAAGYVVNLWFPLIDGFGVVYLDNPYDAGENRKIFKKYPVSIIAGTPGLMKMYTDKIPAQMLTRLKYAISGGSRLEGRTAEQFEEKFGLPVREGYNSSELTGVASINIQDIDWTRDPQIGSKKGTVGQALPGIVIKVVNPATFEELNPGEEGLLIAKGLNVMIGYLDKPGLTEKVMKDGYFITGDTGTMDDDGFITITGRQG